MRWALVFIAACGTSNPGGEPSPDGGNPGDPPANDTRLLPLSVDRTWTYEVTSTYPSCPSGTHEQRVIGTGEIDGRPTFRVRGFCGLEGETNVDGDRVEDHYDWGPLGWTRMLDEPVEDGHAWTTTNGSATFGMHYEDAGNDCWTVVQEVSYTSTWTYCRGVGLTHYEMIDLGGGTIRAELK
jgi:hypothetical protein